MSYNPDEGFPRVVPSLSYRDVGGAVEWTRRVFGFAPELVYESDGVMLHADMTLEGGFFMFEAGDPGPGDVPDRSMTLVYVSDVDRHHRHAAAEGAVVVDGPRDRPWGLRQYRVRDVEGHLWEFTQHVRDVDPTAWGARVVSSEQTGR